MEFELDSVSDTSVTAFRRAKIGAPKKKGAGGSERVHYREPNNSPGSRNVFKCQQKSRFSGTVSSKLYVYFHTSDR